MSNFSRQSYKRRNKDTLSTEVEQELGRYTVGSIQVGQVEI
ncbi:MAG: hypothetical protein WB005_18060 [Pseudolabrys sp.]